MEKKRKPQALLSAVFTAAFAAAVGVMAFGTLAYSLYKLFFTAGSIK